MQSKQKLLALTVAALFGATAQPVFAQDSGAAGTSYVGASLGQADTDASGLDSDTSFQIFGGYMFTDNLGVEGGYSKYGTFEGGSTSMDADGFYLAGRGAYQINDQFSVVGKLGVVHYGFETTSGGGMTSGDGTSTLVGIGVDYNVNQSVAVGASYDMISDVEDADVSAFWLNVKVNLDSL